MLGEIASIATLVLFVFYFVGRGITIFMVRKLWKDKIVQGETDYSQYHLVDSIGKEEDPIYGALISQEGIRDLHVYEMTEDAQGIPRKRGKEIYNRNFLNIDEGIAIRRMSGDLFPTLQIEYLSYDYMKVSLEWRDNLKNGVFSEMVHPRHTVRSFFYYLLR